MDGQIEKNNKYDKRIRIVAMIFGGYTTVFGLYFSILKLAGIKVSLMQDNLTLLVSFPLIAMAGLLFLWFALKGNNIEPHAKRKNVFIGLVVLTLLAFCLYLIGTFLGESNFSLSDVRQENIGTDAEWADFEQRQLRFESMIKGLSSLSMLVICSFPIVFISIQLKRSKAHQVSL